MPIAFYRHLTDDGLVGDGTNNDAAVNGVSTSVPFYAGPAAGKRWTVQRLIILVQDNAVFDAEDYGGVGTLANGVEIDVYTGGVTGSVKIDLLDGDAISGLAHYAEVCYDLKYHDFGSGDNFAAARWTFGAAGGPIHLHSKDSDKLVVTINDDLSTLVKHNFMIQGLEWDAAEFVPNES